MGRGERNNNPGNIDQDGIKFKGEVASSDPRFKAFESPVMGIRAIARLLLTYFDRYGLNTVRGIINRWAPPVENNTTAYVDDVAKRAGVDADAALDLTDAAIMTKLVTAIIWHENGECIYTEHEIEDGVDAAY